MANYKDDLQGPAPSGSGSTAQSGEQGHTPFESALFPSEVQESREPLDRARAEEFWREIFVTALPILLESDALTFGGAARATAIVADQALAEFTRRWPTT